MSKFNPYQLNKIKNNYSQSWTNIDVNVPLANTLPNTPKNLLKSVVVTHENYLGDDRGKITTRFGGGSKGIKYENKGLFIKFNKQHGSNSLLLGKSWRY